MAEPNHPESMIFAVTDFLLPNIWAKQPDRAEVFAQWNCRAERAVRLRIGERNKWKNFTINSKRQCGISQKNSILYVKSWRLLPPNCNSADAWNVSLSWRRTTHWYIPLSSRLTLDMISVSPNRADCGNWRPSLYHVMCCNPVDMPLLVMTQRNSAVPPMCTLSTFGTMSTCSGDVIDSRNSALASPPAFDAEHLYVPASSVVTASMASTGPNKRTRGPLMTANDSMPVFRNHLQWKKKRDKTNKKWTRRMWLRVRGIRGAERKKDKKDI